MNILKRLSSWALAACLCTTSTHALAQGASLSQSLTGAPKQAYDSGMMLYGDGDPAGALTKFTHAYEGSGDPRLLWNMAVCEKEQRHYANAAVYIEQYLAEAPDLSERQQADATETLGALRAFYSPLALEGVPEGATVAVDGDVKGTTPLTRPVLVDLGAHQVTVSKAGYRTWTQQIEVVGNAEVEVSPKLELLPAEPSKALTATLTVTTSGVKDTLAIDGKVVGSHRWEGALKPGSHAVRVTAPGKKPYESHVDLTAGSTRTLHVTLEDERNSTWYWIAGGAALAAGAVGGYFLLRPEDSPGSHPTGSLATVYLP